MNNKLLTSQSNRGGGRSSQCNLNNIILQLHAVAPDKGIEVPEGTTVTNPYSFSITKDTKFSGICKLDKPSYVMAYGSKPWYASSDKWPDASKVSDLTTINGGVKFNTGKVIDMSYMFNSCSNLTSLDFSSFDTSKVTDMHSMFFYCSSLTSLDLSSFDTSKVTDMGYMFGGCKSFVTLLDLTSFDTSNVTDMGYMFYYCDKLRSIDISSFNTSKVTDMQYMFAYCEHFISLNLNSFDTSKVTNMRYMFKDCSNLSSIKCRKGFDCSNVTDMNNMFINCSEPVDKYSLLHLKNVKSSLIESGSSSNDWVVKNIGGIRGVHYIVDSVI